MEKIIQKIESLSRNRAKLGGQVQSAEREAEESIGMFRALQEQRQERRKDLGESRQNLEELQASLAKAKEEHGRFLQAVHKLKVDMENALTEAEGLDRTEEDTKWKCVRTLADLSGRCKSQRTKRQTTLHSNAGTKNLLPTNFHRLLRSDAESDASSRRKNAALAVGGGGCGFVLRFWASFQFSAFCFWRGPLRT